MTVSHTSSTVYEAQNPEPTCEPTSSQPPLLSPSTVCPPRERERSFTLLSRPRPAVPWDPLTPLPHCSHPPSDTYPFDSKSLPQTKRLQWTSHPPALPYRESLDPTPRLNVSHWPVGAPFGWTPQSRPGFCLRSLTGPLPRPLSLPPRADGWTLSPLDSTEKSQDCKHRLSSESPSSSQFNPVVRNRGHSAPKLKT